MEFLPLSLPGLVLIKPRVQQDHRGCFVKSYSRRLFGENNIDFVPQEEFYSVSAVGVLRGMHFQTSPAQYGKLVHCVKGRIYDVVLDIRKGSPTYGRTWSHQLDEVQREAVYLPPGFAHGFYSLESSSIVSYLVTQGHDPLHDQGIRWNSFNHQWPCLEPILSERDRSFLPFSEFSSSFIYK